MLLPENDRTLRAGVARLARGLFKNAIIAIPISPFSTILAFLSVPNLHSSAATLAEFVLMRIEGLSYCQSYFNLLIIL